MNNNNNENVEGNNTETEVDTNPRSVSGRVSDGGDHLIIEYESPDPNPRVRRHL